MSEHDVKEYSTISDGGQMEILDYRERSMELSEARFNYKTTRRIFHYHFTQEVPELLKLFFTQIPTREKVKVLIANKEIEIAIDPRIMIICSFGFKK